MPRMDKEGAELSPEAEENFLLLRQLVETGEADLVLDSSGSGKLKIIYACDRSMPEKGLHTSHWVMEQKMEFVVLATSRHHRSSSIVPESQLPSPDSYCRGRKMRAGAVKEPVQEMDHALKDSQEKPDMEKDAGPEDSLHKGGQDEMARTGPGPGGVKPEESEPESEEADNHGFDFIELNNPEVRRIIMAKALREIGELD